MSKIPKKKFKVKNMSIGNHHVELEFECYDDAVTFYNWMKSEHKYVVFE